MLNTRHIKKDNLRGFIGFSWVVALSALIPPEVDPDWAAYERIYTSGGAWLSQSGRDPVFLFIINSYKAVPVFGASYEGFRAFVNFFFAVFSFMFLSGRLIPLPPARFKYVLLAFVAFSLMRFSVQIREGIAAVFFLAALGVGGAASSRLGATPISGAFSKAFLFVIAAGTHIIGSLLLCLRGVSFLSKAQNSYFRAATSLIVLPLSVSVLAIIYTDPTVLDAISFAALSFSGDRFADEGGLGVGETIYWVIMLACACILYASFHKSLRSPASPCITYIKFGFICAGPALFFLWSLIMLSKINDVSPVFTVLAVRTYDALLATAGLLASAFCKTTFGSLFVSSFILLRSLQLLGIA